MKRFWMVVCLENTHEVGQNAPYGTGPKCRHTLKEDAQKEAERLARSAPRKTFVVLEAVDAVCLPVEAPVDANDIKVRKVAPATQRHGVIPATVTDDTAFTEATG